LAAAVVDTADQAVVLRWCHELYDTRRRRGSAALLAGAEFERSSLTNRGGIRRAKGEDHSRHVR
jgi:hypothetical protein